MAAERGPIRKYLAEDHARLEDLLARSVPSGGAFERGPFDAFRAGLLRHIAIEEKILFREARAARAGEPLELFRRLRIEHGALASLLVPTPTAALVTELRSILGPHNEAEEGAGGVYECCDALLAAGAARLLERMHAYPVVKVAPYNDGPRVLRTAEAALRVSAKQF
jgi:hemerythrin HHE cation binding domain-containing protein